MITWTQGGTTKSINNNNIVYAKQGADGEPVLIDRVIAVDTSTNPPTESVVYQSNSILRALSSSEINLPSMSGGISDWKWELSPYNTGKYSHDYLWIQYPTTYNTTNTGTTYATLSTYCITKNNPSNAWPSSTEHYFRKVALTNVHDYQPTLPVNIQYTYAVPYRVVVKVTARMYALGVRVTRGNGSTIIAQGGNGNSITAEQVLYDGLMDSTTRNYSFSCALKLRGFTVDDGGSNTANRTVSNMTFIRSADPRGPWGQDRNRANFIALPQFVTRTIEIYDPDTGTLVASNTSALSTTWTARH